MPVRSLLLAFLGACVVQEPAILQTASGAGGEQACYTGPAETRGRGVCREGVRKRSGGTWGPCQGEVTPAVENCDDGLDGDCDGSGGPGEPADGECTRCVPTGVEVCNGKDDDCNGLTDDGGVLNACGKCLGEICYTQAFERPADCAAEGRSCEGVAATETDGITIDEAQRVGAPDLIVGLAGRGEIAAIDPGSLEVRWRAAGPDEAKVASVQDGAWLLANDELQRIDAGGEQVCTVRLDHPGSALVADARGRAFAATTGSEVQAFEPDVVIDGAVPTCGALDLVPSDDRKSLPLQQLTTALATGAGVLWTGSAPARRLDLATFEWEDVTHRAPGPVLLDPDGNAWFGGDDFHRLAGLSHEDTRISLRGEGIAHLAPYVLTLQPDERQLGRVLTVHFSVDSVPYPPEAGEPLHGLTTVGASAFAAAGEQLLRWDGAAWTVAQPIPGVKLHLDQDARRGVAARTARWTAVFDGKYSNAQWVRLGWSPHVPPGATAEVRLAFAQDEAALATAPRCGPFLGPPAELGGCPGARMNRHVSVEVFLTTTAGHDAPWVENLELGWTRP